MVRLGTSGSNSGSNSQPDPNLTGGLSVTVTGGGGSGGSGSSYTVTTTSSGSSASYAYDPNFLTVGHIYPMQPDPLTMSCPGHVTSEDLIEYGDGVVVSHCALCQARIEITRVPGGMNVLRLKDLVARLVASNPDELSELLGEFADQKNAFAEEHRALDEAADLLRTAETLLKEKSV